MKKVLTAAAIGGVYAVFALIISHLLLPNLEKAATISHSQGSFAIAVAVLVFCYWQLLILHTVLGFLKMNNVLVMVISIVFTAFAFGFVVFILRTGKRLIFKPKPKDLPLPNNPQSRPPVPQAPTVPPPMPQNPQV